MLNVGLVGFGFAGQVFHAPVIRAVDGLRLTTIVRRSREPDPRYPDVAFVASVDELLARPVDLVVIATPNPSHHPIAAQCLHAGRHVVIDKPFTTTLAETEDLLRLAEAQSRVLSAYQNRRYVGDFVTVQRVLRDRVLGRVTSFECHFDRFRPALRAGAWRERPEPGSGVWFDLGPHLLDQTLVLFGVPEALAADIRTERDGAEADDAFDVTLYYPRMRALLRASVLTAAPGPSFLVHGTQGSFAKYGLDSQEAALKAGRSPREAGWDADPPELYGRLTTPDGARPVPTIPSNYTHYYENVRDAIRGRTALAVGPDAIRNVMRGLELGVVSSRERRTLRWPASP